MTAGWSASSAAPISCTPWQSLALGTQASADDENLPIRDRILAALGKLPWAPRIGVVARDGVVELWGTLSDERQRQALIVAAENVSGVKEVHDHLVWVGLSGVDFLSAENERKAEARGI